jgi:hypothetical protein
MGREGLTITMQQTRTLIDTLGDGYRMVNRRPLLVLLPIAFNIYLWFGTQISFAPLIDRLVGLIERMQPSSASAESTMFDSLRMLDMRYPLAMLNALPSLPTALLIGKAGSGAPINIDSVGGAFLAFLGVNLLTFVFSAIFLARLSGIVRNEAQPFRESISRTVRVGLTMLGTAGVFAAVGIALLLPFVVFSSILMALSQGLGLFMLSLLVAALFWAQIYLGFTNEAISIGGLGPLRAIHASFNIVRHHFWGTIGLLLLGYVIWYGFAAVWNSLSGSQIGVALAIIGSAYIGCGIEAARMIFIQDRLQRWQAGQQN